MKIIDIVRNYFRDPGQIYIKGKSEKGIREENQDNILMIFPSKDQVLAQYYKDDQLIAKPIDIWDFDYARVAVADGMGGHFYGKEIAESAIEALIDIPPQTSENDMRDSILEIHAMLQDKYHSKYQKHPGTTIVLADIHIKTSKTLLLNVGDSRAYIVKKNCWMNKTHDHTITEFYYRDAEIDKIDYEAQLEMPTSKIVQALGYGSSGIVKDQNGNKPIRYSKKLRIDLAQDLPRKLSHHADVSSFFLKKGETLLLATDGLWSADNTNQWIPEDDIDYYEENTPCNLIEKALDNGSRDNISVAIVGFQ